MKAKIYNLNETGMASIAINNVGSGQVEGIGIGQNGEPGIIRKKTKKLRDVVISNNPLKRIMRK